MTTNARGGVRLAALRTLLPLSLCFTYGNSLAAVLPGRLIGEFSATGAGAASYAIPISVPAGMNGLKPSLSLAYNSQSGDGLAGFGWQLTGFSQITRCGLSKAVDGHFQGVRYSTEDRFCLDGQPLILVSGIYGGNAAEYRTEIHGYQKVISYGTQGSGPAYFEVRHPDGLTWRYGNDADSRIEAPGIGNEVRTWALNEVEDKYYQRMLFTYSEDSVSGEYLPAEIRWTYAYDQTPNDARYRLTFGYENRPADDVHTGYVWGSPWRAGKRLSTIDYEHDGGAGFARIHRYTLSYKTPVAWGTPRSQLASVQQCSAQDCLPPTTFLWLDGTPGFNGESAGPTADYANAVFGDYDGDGDTDMFVPIAGFWHLILVNGGTFGTAINTGRAFLGTGYPLESNGDGRADLLTKGPGNVWYVYESTGNPAGSSTFTDRNTGISTSAMVAPSPVDMDGDGLHDLVYVISNTAVVVRHNTGGNFGAEQPSGISGSSSVAFLRAQDGTLQPADFDGDGREDLLVARQSAGLWTWSAYLSNGGQFSAAPLPIAYLYPTASTDDLIALDINGDGLSDLIFRNGNQWLVRLSRGTNASGWGFFSPGCAESIAANSAALTIPMDVNGDGRMDLVRPYGTGWRAHLSDGQCYANNSQVLDFKAGSGVVRLAAADVSGDGQPDLLLGQADNNWRVHLRSAGPAPRVQRITDGLGNITQPTYHALSGWNGYTATGTAAIPVERLLRGGPLYVLNQYVMSTGLSAAGSDSFTVSFSYANGRLDMTGRGFLGFETVKATDSRNGLMTETLYRQAFPFTARIEKQTVWNGTHPVTVDDPTWNVNSSASASADAAGDYHFVYQSQSVHEDYEVDGEGLYANGLVRRTTRILSGWNFNHGVATSEQTLVESPLVPGVSYSTTRALTLNDSLRTARWCLGRPDRVDVTRSSGSGESITRSVQYIYLVGTCRVRTQTIGPPGIPAQQLRTTYIYDAWGRNSATVSSPGDGSASSRQTMIAYDSTGYRAASESQLIDGESAHVTGHSWNNGLGLEASRTDVQGRATSWSYDGFGRLLVETRPVGNSVTSYTSCGVCFPANAKYKIRISDSTGHWSETYHDALGRTVGRASVLIDGTESRQAIAYDVLGRVERESVPYVAGANVYWVTYVHDLLNRIKLENRPVDAGTPSGALQRYTYSGTRTDVQDAELRTTTYTHDPEGRLQGVNAPLNGGATYSYSPFGELKSMVDAGGNTTSFEYDALGHRTAISSPDLGTRRFAYNAFGELITQTDAMTPPASTTLVYDQLGRLRQRVEPEGVTTWTYVSAVGPGKGELQSVSAPTDQSTNGFQENYSYDALGRLQRTVTSLDGISYQTDYTYNILGQLASMTYPETVGEQRPQFVYSYANGHLATVAEVIPYWQNLLLYRVAATDALGRETLASFGGAAVDRQDVYDLANTRVKAIRSGTALGSAAQNYSYAWDKAGNLLQRQDLNQGITESFTYDGLDRLLTAQRNGALTLSMSYSADGNIQSKSDVGNYTYNRGVAQPHAVRNIAGGSRGNLNFGYDANGNMASRGGATLAWTSYNLPKQVNFTGNRCSGDCATFTYGPNRQRIKQITKTGGVTSTIWYIAPHFEVEQQPGFTRFRSHVFANGAVVYTQAETTSWVWEGYYVLRDYQHSIDTLVRAVGAGSNRLQASFDAWGKRRNADWTADPADARFADSRWTRRGYTGHEHLDNVKLIHMNGRVEDPILGRMLSPDPVLGALSRPQTLNPYTYAGNNPTSYIDPSGFFLGRIGRFFQNAVRAIGHFGERLIQKWGREIAAAVAAYYTAGLVNDLYVSSAIAAGADAGAINSVGGMYVAGLEAESMPANIFLQGLAGGAVGGAVATGSVKGAIGGALTGGAFGVVDVAYAGQYSLGRVATEGLVGGTASVAQGGPFWRGFGFSAASAGAEYGYRTVVGYGTDWGPGGAARNKKPDTWPYDHSNNIGLAVKDVARFRDCWFCLAEGGRPSRLLNEIPGINAVAGLHDVWQIESGELLGEFARSFVLNVPGMAITAAAVYPALLHGAPATMLAIYGPE